MSDVFYLRPISPPVSPEDVQQMARYSGSCFNLHKVDWRYSFLAVDGARMLCWYQAPDAESVRIALRQLGSDMNAVWSGHLLHTDGAAAEFDAVNVVAEIAFDPSAPADRSALLSLLAPLMRHDSAARLLVGLMSSSGTRLACLLRSESTDGARSALEAVALPVSRIWACQAVTPSIAPS